MAKGLPEFTDYPAIEFGLFDSEGPFVIGQCGDDPIIVEQPSGTVIIERDNQPALYMNASVELIPDFIALFCGERALVDVRSEMVRLDPDALDSFEGCFWAQVLDDAEAMETSV